MKCHPSVFALSLVAFLSPGLGGAQVLNKRQQLLKQTFWDNRDWNWYERQIPFFECPDPDIETTYYYRWELLTKHLTYGSPNSGYSFTEFIDRPFWSGAYGAISCPSGHQLYEARWLREPRIAQDYLRYWFRTPGAQPRNYSAWLGDSAWAVNQVHPNAPFFHDLLPDLVANYEAWERRSFVPEVGLFWQVGHDDGMEFNIDSRQTADILRGAPSYRPSFNAYMWADAIAIAKLARRSGQPDLAAKYEAKAKSLKEKMLSLLWDEKRQFFFPVYKNDEERDGFKVRAMTKTHETGQFAGSPYGRQLIGYVPWQFEMIEPGTKYEASWAKLMDPDGFFAKFGPTTVERKDPMFLLKESCCWWSGQSWPFATTQTAKGLANLLRKTLEAKPPVSKPLVSKADYVQLMQIYAKSHRKDGKPYLAEALHPDTGSFAGHDGYNHSEHYFHSGYTDLVITGLAGLVTRDDDTLEVSPLAPDDWSYFAIDDVPYRGRRIAIVWDKTGKRYGRGAGMSLFVDGRKVGSSPKLGRMVVPGAVKAREPRGSKNQIVATNFAVNNDGTFFPRISASHSGPRTPIGKVNDGNYWYTQHPPNRWTTEGSPNAKDWLEVDFGAKRPIHSVKLYFLDDEGELGSKIQAPKQVEIETWDGSRWHRKATITRPQARRATEVRFKKTDTAKLRVTLIHADGARSGLTEIEAWGPATLPVEAAPPPAGNLAYNPKPEGFPKASASFSDRFGGVPPSAIDGRTVFLPTPTNRWTSYESKATSDWLEIDFGRPTQFRRVELAIYDDGGGVQPPTSYTIQVWTGTEWRDVPNLTKSPALPAGGQWNVAKFAPQTASKVRIVFTHRGEARSGVTEVLVWND